MEFGKLQEVDVRELWRHEQYNFSEWLAKEENIEMLGNEVGVTFAEIRREVFVGSYRCDLVAQDETSGAKIIIENQLEATNHDHLGKIITYASGLEATVVIWIVKEAREEHRSAIEWLNGKTTEDVSFGIAKYIKLSNKNTVMKSIPHLINEKSKMMVDKFNEKNSPIRRKNCSPKINNTETAKIIKIAAIAITIAKNLSKIKFLRTGAPYKTFNALCKLLNI